MNIEELPPTAAARVVNDRYRLQAADLHGRAVQAQIVNVSLQGVEELQIVLHLKGFAKPLVLTPAQRNMLLQLMRGDTFGQWVGQCITLRPIGVGGEAIIQIAEARPAQKPLPVLRPAPLQIARFTSLWTGLTSADATTNSYLTGFLILLVLSLLFGAAYLIENPDAWRYFLGS